MSQLDPEGARLSSLWIEAADERPVRPSRLSHAAREFGRQDADGDAVAFAVEKELVELVSTVASTTQEMHRMATGRTAPSVPLWSLARLVADAMGRIFLICTEPKDMGGWVRFRRRNTEHADRFWAEISKILPDNVVLPADLGPKVTLKGLDAALTEMIDELPGGLATATDAHRWLAHAACQRMLGAGADDSAVAVHAGILQALYRLAGNAVHLASPVTFERQQTAMCFGWLGILTPETLAQFREFAGITRIEEADELLR